MTFADVVVKVDKTDKAWVVKENSLENIESSDDLSSLFRGKWEQDDFSNSANDLEQLGPVHVLNLYLKAFSEQSEQHVHADQGESWALIKKLKNYCFYKRMKKSIQN